MLFNVSVSFATFLPFVAALAVVAALALRHWSHWKRRNPPRRAGADTDAAPRDSSSGLLVGDEDPIAREILLGDDGDGGGGGGGGGGGDGGGGSDDDDIDADARKGLRAALRSRKYRMLWLTFAVVGGCAALLCDRLYFLFRAMARRLTSTRTDTEVVCAV